MSEESKPHANKARDIAGTLEYVRTLLPPDADPMHAAALDEIERWLRKADWQKYLDSNKETGPEPKVTRKRDERGPGGHKILVVEDNPDMLRIIVSALTGAGYQVVPAYGGEDALIKVAKQHFDLVLTDLAMPHVSGVSVIEAIKRNPETQHIPVVAVTAYMWEAIAQAAGKAGCNGYIPKPFQMKELVHEIQKYLKRPGP